MLGVLINVGTVLVGSLVGLFLKRGIPEKLTEALMIGIGLCTVFIGISGCSSGREYVGTYFINGYRYSDRDVIGY